MSSKEPDVWFRFVRAHRTHGLRSGQAAPVFFKALRTEKFSADGRLNMLWAAQQDPSGVLTEFV